MGSVPFFFVTPQYPRYVVGVCDRCHAPLLLEHSVEGPLGYRWLIGYFGDMHCRQGRHIFISIIGPSDLKGAGRDIFVRLSDLDFIRLNLSTHSVWILKWYWLPFEFFLCLLWEKTPTALASRNCLRLWSRMLPSLCKTADWRQIDVSRTRCLTTAMRLSRLAHFKSDRPMTEIKMRRHSATMYIVKVPNEPSISQ